MATPVYSDRDVQFRLVYSPGFTTESSFGTALGNGSLTKAFNLENRLPVELVRKIDRIVDCTGQFVIDEQDITRYVRIPIDFYPDADSLGWIMAGLLGVAAAPSGAGPFVSALAMLGKNVFTLPTTTIAIQYAGATVSDPGAVFAGVAVNKVTITGRAGERIRATGELFAKLPVAGSGFTAPDCSNTVPLRLDQSAFSVNSVNRLAPTSGDPHNITNQIVFSYSNEIIDDLLAFPIGNQDPVVWQRGNIRPVDFAWQVQGRAFDSLHALAIASPRTFYTVSFRIGNASPSVTLTASNAMLKSDDRPTEFVGAARLSHLNLHLEPQINGATLPLSCSVSSNSSGGFMQ